MSDISNYLSELKQEGWRIEHTAKNRLRLTHPEATATIIAPGSAAQAGPRTLKNIRAEVRRARPIETPKPAKVVRVKAPPPKQSAPQPKPAPAPAPAQPAERQPAETALSVALAPVLHLIDDQPAPPPPDAWVQRPKLDLTRPQYDPYGWRRDVANALDRFRRSL